MKRVYLDNAATTTVAGEVMDAMIPYFTENYGNASSIHSFGKEAKEALEKSRAKIAAVMNANPYEIIFTSGGTESINLALKGFASANSGKGKHIITTKIEHSAVLKSCRWLEKQGFEVTYLNVDKSGLVDSEDLKNSIRKDTILISIIHGNNEIGTIQNIGEIGKIAKEKGVNFHIDACQSFTKTEINVEKQNLDMVSINAHKIHGPKGVGALYIREGIKIDALLHGGDHERKIRPGTENLAGIAGFAKAAEITTHEDIERMKNLRDYFIKRVLEEIPKSRLNGHPEKRLCNNTNITFKFIEGESMLMLLDRAGIAVSTGSACSSRALEPSHVLIAIGLPPEDAHGSLRMSISKYTSIEDLDYTIENLKKIVERLRNLSPFK